MKRFTRDQMAARVARDIPGRRVREPRDRPADAGGATHLPKDREIFLHSENGLLGMGPAPAPGDEDPDLINAGKQPVTLLTGGAYFHHARFVRDDARRPPRLLRARRVPGLGARRPRELAHRRAGRDSRGRRRDGPRHRRQAACS